jgi:hypothetical protein
MSGLRPFPPFASAAVDQDAPEEVNFWGPLKITLISE